MREKISLKRLLRVSHNPSSHLLRDERRDDERGEDEEGAPHKISLKRLLRVY